MLSAYDLYRLSRLEDYYLNPDNFIRDEDPDAREEAMWEKADADYADRCFEKYQD